jgi:lipopolysaccharide export system permease protein
MSRMGLKPIRFTKTIVKYVLMELSGPFFLGLLIFTFVLFMKEVLDLIELVINKGVGLKVVLEMVVYIMPSFLVLTIPMAVLVAALTAFGRLSTDSEITAMKASGISLYTLFVPVFVFSVIASGLTFFCYAKALPWGNHNFRVALYELARTKASIGLKAQVFNTTFQGLVIYIDEISYADNSFSGVMIADSRDQRNPQIIFARKGRLISDEKVLRVILRLYNGASHPKSVVTPLTLKYQVVEFPTLDILLTLQGDDEQTNIDLPRTDRDMTITQLYEQYTTLRQQDQKIGVPDQGTQTNPGSQSPGMVQSGSNVKQFLWDSFVFPGRLSSPYLVELHKRFSIPFACMVFGLIATPLGIQSRRAGKSGGYAISLVLLLIYYIFITAGESLGDSGKLPVFLAVWTPNILLGITGIFLLIRVARR